MSSSNSSKNLPSTNQRPRSSYSEKCVKAGEPTEDKPTPEVQDEEAESNDEHNEAPKVTRTQQAFILVAMMLQSFQTQGYTQSYGMFQVHYGSPAAVADGVLPSSQMTDTAWIAAVGSIGNGGTVALFALLYYPYMPLIGRYIKWVCFLGTGLVSVGLLTASWSTNLSHLVVTQGIFVGLGNGLLLYTLPVIIPEYFSKRSGLVQGITAAGVFDIDTTRLAELIQVTAASLGGVFYSPVLRKLLQVLGTRNTLRALACMNAMLLGVASGLAQPARKYEKRTYSIVKLKIFKDPIFSLLMVVNFLNPLTFATTFNFGPDFSESLGFSETMAGYLLALVCGIAIPFRILMGYLGDRFGHQNGLIAGTLVSALSVWGLWLPAACLANDKSWMAHLVFYGISAGTFISFMNLVQKDIFGHERYYVYSGAFSTVRGVGYLVGGPMAGAIVKKDRDDELSSSDFAGLVLFTGISMALCLVCLVVVRQLEARRTGWLRIR
ncbi:major facilitator superfamily domain-containing protein [Clohesyomyces aquaticus]|uniref:Major facilitator superfamily domain-containing protein n=1 Tax=Clohesyomyces aquaticus TaxID=1231657 RepID=A0A1Y1ZQ33_9PLEO|nr:major facilitator superfamily domain-containing protein [Clohesyomyces aquaticus]